MSLETWLAEFYPEEATALLERLVGPHPQQMPEPTVLLQLVEQGLLKLTGLREENLRKHDVSLSCCRVRGGSNFWQFGASQCGLCHLAVVATDGKYCVGNLADDLEQDCSRCVVYQANADCACDDWQYLDSEDDLAGRDGDGDDLAPWLVLYATNNPEPMIRLLERTREWLLQKGQ